MPISGSFGWALYGLIPGGSGLLAGNTKVAATVLTVQLNSPKELAKVTKALHEAGALNVEASSPIAA